MTEGLQVLRHLKRTLRIVEPDDVMLVRPPIPNDTVPQNCIRNVPVFQKLQKIPRIDPGDYDTSDRIASFKNLGKVELRPRYVKGVAKGHKKHVPAASCAV